MSLHVCYATRQFSIVSFNDCVLVGQIVNTVSLLQNTHTFMFANQLIMDVGVLNTCNGLHN